MCVWFSWLWGIGGGSYYDLNIWMTPDLATNQQTTRYLLNWFFTMYSYIYVHDVLLCGEGGSLNP